ncbi:MAG: DUF6702 family protein [Bacteroidota bacterium]
MILLSIFLLINSFLPGSAAAEDHKFHLSKCQIDYSVADQALQITLHIFIDDLEEALQTQSTDQLFIGTFQEHEGADQRIFSYIQQKLKLEVDNEAVNYGFVGKEVSEDLQAVWCYLEVTEVASLQSLSVSNDILMETFDDQKNIVAISGPNKKSGYFLFMKGKSSGTVEF